MSRPSEIIDIWNYLSLTVLVALPYILHIMGVEAVKSVMLIASDER